MKLQSSLYMNSILNHSLVSTTTAKKAETTQTQVTRLTTDVAAEAPKAARARFLSSLASDTTGGVFVAMLKYQKMMNKEAREDRKIARMAAQLELMGKESKLELENNKIAEMRDEASDRFDHAMGTATVEMITGILEPSFEFFINSSASLLKEDVEESNETMKSYLEKLRSMNEASEAFRGQQEAFVAASQRLTKKEDDDD